MCSFYLFTSIQQVNKGEQKQSISGRSGEAAIKVDVPDIVSVSSCGDLTLPPGAGLCIDTIHGPVYLVRNTFCYREILYMSRMMIRKCRQIIKIVLAFCQVHKKCAENIAFLY